LEDTKRVLRVAVDFTHNEANKHRTTSSNVYEIRIPRAALQDFRAVSSLNWLALTASSTRR
jgi:hypothetical protein